MLSIVCDAFQNLETFNLTEGLKFGCVVFIQCNELYTKHTGFNNCYDVKVQTLYFNLNVCTSVPSYEPYQTLKHRHHF